MPDNPSDVKKSDPDALPLGRRGRIGLAIYLIVLMVLLVYLIIKVWPPAGKDEGGVISLFRVQFSVSADVRQILIVMVVGALGSYLHGVASFANYAGARKLIRSWTLWYAFRPLVGMPLALIFYFAVRGGFLSGGAEVINPFGIAAMAGLVGMFSDKASEKLKDLFDNLFPTADKRTDKLQGSTAKAAASATEGQPDESTEGTPQAGEAEATSGGTLPAGEAQTGATTKGP